MERFHNSKDKNYFSASGCHHNLGIYNPIIGGCMIYFNVERAHGVKIYKIVKGELLPRYPLHTAVRR